VASGHQQIIIGGHNWDDQTAAALSPASASAGLHHFQWRADAASVRLLLAGGHMQRGEVWWVEFDERRPVVLLSEDESSGFVAMQVVAPADADISDLGVEVAVGVLEGLPFGGVLRFAYPWPGFTPCTWLTTLRRDDLVERAGALSSAKLSEIDDALRAVGRRTEWTPAAAARLSEIKDSLRRRTQGDGLGTNSRADEGRSRPRASDGPQHPTSKITIYG
jgi:mRNA interferase MazF